MKSLKAKFRKTDIHEWSKNDERLLAAVEHGEADKVASLLAKKGVSSVKLDSEGKSALHAAATRGHTECLAIILANGADLSVTDASGSTALHLAARHEHHECAQKLLQSKCVVDAVDGSGKTALHHAAASGSLQTVNLLCEHKSLVNLRDAEGLSPLLLSARQAHAEVCNALLDWGADINACDNSGRTAVMLASEGGSVAVTEALVSRGADLRTVDSLGHNVMHYAKLSGSNETWATLNAALHSQANPDPKSPRTPQHDQVARLSGDRSTTPKKRKAPPPPISPLQGSGLASPPYMTPTETPVSGRSDRRFNYKDEEVRSSALRQEVEQLQEEKSMLLETIEDLKLTAERAASGGESGQGTAQPRKEKHSPLAAEALVSALQAKISALSLENQQLAGLLKKHLPPQGGEDLMETSRPNSMASNTSFHSTQGDFEVLPPVSSPGRPDEGMEEEVTGEVSLGQEGEEGEKAEEEIRLLRQALESVQTKLLESRKENRSLQAKLQPGVTWEGRGRDRDHDERAREREEEEEERGREGELLESLAELQAKLTETQERYHQATEELQEARTQAEEAGREREQQRQGSDMVENQEVHRQSLEREVRELKAQLVHAATKREEAVERVLELEKGLRRAEEEQGSVRGEQEKRNLLAEKRHKEAQEEIRLLQEALSGTVPVEAAARDFEEMKAEMSEVTAGLQRRLLELSHSYSETKSQLGSTRTQLEEALKAASQAQTEAQARGSSSPTSTISSDAELHKQQQGALQSQVEVLQNLVVEAERKHVESQQEIALLRQEAEEQAEGSVSLADHTQVVSSLGSAIKELEGQSEVLRQQLSQRALQVDVLQNRLTVEKDVTPDDSVSRLEHDTVRQGLESEVGRLTQLLQGALRKQDEMALEAAAAWQEVRESRGEREALQELVVSREKQNQTLSTRLAEAQDAVAQLKQLVENHVSSEREKNKRIDDLSKEVVKLKDAVNSLTQLPSGKSSSPIKRQQSQPTEILHQQIKQLQYQLAESKKQHHEIVSVYRMHLLYAVQGQMDEDVQKALKQILMMCKMPTTAKSAC